MKHLVKHWDRDEFITPFDRVFDKIMSDAFPTFSRDFGVDVFQTSAYPKCDIKDFSDRLELVFEIPGSTKENVTIDIDGEVLSIVGSKVNETESYYLINKNLIFIIWVEFKNFTHFF
jgi:HSP20 family molecular chaperone IbpA